MNKTVPDKMDSNQAAPFLGLVKQGQSVWLDYIRRDLIQSGELARLVAQDCVSGVTSNPAIFEKAITSGEEYLEAIRATARAGLSAQAAYEAIAIDDIRAAADVMKAVFEATQGADGFVSLEVSPHLANDTEGTLAEGRRLWRSVDRPNLMIKVPGTPAGISAVRRLIAEGISVNVTLLFARSAYEAAANAYLDGLEAWIAAKGDPRRVASVASFFISRIDSAVDALLEEKISSAQAAEAGSLLALRGKVAIANAKLAYAFFEKQIAEPRWTKLAAAGTRPQRLLWASTGTKNPAYSDVLYVEELIGANTVNTMPPATLEAFRDHGQARSSLAENPARAGEVLKELDSAGISLDAVTDQLLVDGVVLFADAFDKLLVALQARLKTLSP
ncbi:MAG: transaldolase [Burkholderiales bacterium]